MKLNAAASMAEINQLYGGLDETPMIRENHNITNPENYSKTRSTIHLSTVDDNNQ